MAEGANSVSKRHRSRTLADNLDEWMQNRQVEWRGNPKNQIIREWGWQNGRQYPWILPSSKWEQGLWHGIRSDGVNPLQQYLDQNDIQPHASKHNLKSSWILCANLYFPFGQTEEGRDLLAGFVREKISGDIHTVDALHLEYAEDGGLHPSVLLGETGGNRGSGQTSPDLALHVNGRRGLLLIENKLVEHSFYPCSARRTTDSEDRPRNPDPDRCRDIGAVLKDHKAQCHQCAWGRKYWDILYPVAHEEALSGLKCCPATLAGYQLFRQQALAEGIARSGKYDMVYTCVAIDARNKRLHNCLASTGVSELEAGWGSLFRGRAGFKVFTHQDWVVWVSCQGNRQRWSTWLKYVTERYGLSTHPGA